MEWNWTDLLWKGIYALLVFGGGYFVAGWLTGVVNLALERAKLDPIVRRLIVSTVRPVVLSIALFAALAVIGIPMTTFAAMAGASTLAIGLALQGSLSNIASGAMLLSLRPFDADDFITAGGHSGKVRSLKLFVTVLDTPDGNTITLPNDVVFGGPITTFTTTPNSRVDMTWVVGTDTDLDAVRDMVLQAMAADERTLEEPAPSFTVKGMTDLGIEVIGKVWTLNADKWDARSDIQAEVFKKLQGAKVHLPTRAS